MEEQELYNKYLNGKHWENHPILYAEKFTKFLNEKEFSGTIVDIGCGNGRDVQVFDRAGFKTIGIDYDNDVVTETKQLRSSLDIREMNAEHLDFEDNSVEALFMINVIHYVKQQQAIQEAYRVLTPGGYLFIHFNLKIMDEQGTVDYEQSLESVQELISSFTVLHEVVFERKDTIPFPHTHVIKEFILKKT